MVATASRPNTWWAAAGGRRRRWWSTPRTPRSSPGPPRRQLAAAPSQPRRRSGCSAGTSTMQMRSPSGSAITSPAIPTAPASAPAGSQHRVCPAPVASRPGRAPAAQRHAGPWRLGGPPRTAPGTRRPGRRPCPLRPIPELAVGSPAPACRGRTPAALGVGRPQQHPAVQYLHGVMITSRLRSGMQTWPPRGRSSAAAI